MNIIQLIVILLLLITHTNSFCLNGQYSDDTIEGQEICLEEKIAGCQYYSPLYYLCYSCYQDFTPTGPTGQITACSCTNPTLKHALFRSEAKCIENPIEHCEEHDPNSHQNCIYCDHYKSNTFNSNAGEKQCCAYENQIIDLEEGKKTCVNTILGCKQYSTTPPYNCHTCETGTTGNDGINSTECICDSGKTIFKSSSTEDFVCLETQNIIQNCSEYAGDGTKCKNCENGYFGIGSYNSYNSCCFRSKKRKEDENGNQVCVNEIAGCGKYLSSNLEKCHTCRDNFEGDGINPNEHDSCVCQSPNIQFATEGYDSIYRCVPPIEYCYSYDKTQFTLCQNCYSETQGIKPEGSNSYLYSVCCPGYKVIVQNELSNKMCAYEIKGCQQYSSTDSAVCKVCGDGSSGTDVAQCVCQSPKKFFPKKDKGYVCANEIPLCEAYESETVCSKCSHQKSGGKCCPFGQIAGTNNLSEDDCFVKIVGCESYLKNSDKCYSCNTGRRFIGQGGGSGNWDSCVCDSGTKLIYDFQENEVCIAQDSHCLVASSQNPQTDCSICHVGTSNNINNQCCVRPSFVQEIFPKQCIENAIQGCSEYLQSDTTKCKTCDSWRRFKGGQGSDGQWTTCVCTQEDQIPRLNFSSVYCMPVIENCKQYHTQGSLSSPCTTCSVDSIRFRGLFCCKAPKSLMNIDGQDTCQEFPVIQGCMKYDSNKPNKCIECGPGYEGIGGTPGNNEFDLCYCSSGKSEVLREIEDELPLQICIKEIPNCLLYNESGTDCETCAPGSQLIPQQICCDAPKVLAIDCEGNKYCMETALVPGCSIYVKQDLSKCYQCNSNFVGNGGTEYAYTSCDCPVGYTKVVDENNEGRCVENVLEGCLVYDSEDNTKCLTCDENHPKKGNSSLPNICCAEGQTNKKEDQYYDYGCFFEIDGCEQYASGFSNKCYQCYPGFTPKGTKNQYDSCDCDGVGYSMDSKKEYCGPVIIENCTKYSTDLQDCVKCDQRDYIKQQKTCCLSTYIFLDENSEKICAPEYIPGCDRYLSSDPSKCYSCQANATGTGGSSNAWESCTCNGFQANSFDYNREWYCSESEIEGCRNYKYNEYDQKIECSSCNDNSLTENFGKLCIPCPEGQIPERSNSNVNSYFCVDPISNCNYYNFETKKCKLCSKGFIPTGGSELSYNSCECSSVGKYVIEQYFGSICVPQIIKGCKSYSNQEACNSCYEDSGFSKIGSKCVCTFPKIIGFDKNEKYFCVEPIQYCEIYDDVDSSICHQCQKGFSGSLGNACTCDSNNIVVDNNGNEICVVNTINNCRFYSSSDSTKCHTCNNTYNGVGDSNLYTDCTCDKAEMTDDLGNTVCIVEVQNCKFVNSQSLTKCHTCNESTVSIGNQYQFSCSICGGSNVIVKDENNHNLCVSAKIPNCGLHLKATPTTCYTCQNGYAGDGTDSCSCEGTLKQDENGYDVCISTLIDNCDTYLSSDPQNKCYACSSGTFGIPNEGEKGYPVCCSGNLVKNEQLKYVCTTNFVQNCAKYQTQDTSKCHICEENTISVGTANDYTECKRCQEIEIIAQDESGNEVCVTPIAGCLKYKSTEFKVCHTCDSNFTGVGDDQAFTGCTCTVAEKVAKKDDLGNDICVSDIPNCETYSNSNPLKCFKCDKSSVGVGSVNNYDSCGSCSDIKGMDENGKEICLTTIVKNCQKHLSSNPSVCHTCQENSIGIGTQNQYTKCNYCLTCETLDSINPSLIYHLEFNGNLNENVNDVEVHPLFSPDRSYVEGIKDKAIQFVNTYANQDCSCITSVDTKEMQNLDNFSISYWVKIDEAPLGPYLSIRSEETLDTINLILHASGDQISYQSSTISTPLYSAIGQNTWHHVAFTRNTEFKFIKVYLDGTPLAISPSGTDSFDDPFNPKYFQIGGGYNKCITKVQISDLRVYNIAINAEEVYSIMDYSQVIDQKIMKSFCDSNNMDSTQYTDITVQNQDYCIDNECFQEIPGVMRKYTIPQEQKVNDFLYLPSVFDFSRKCFQVHSKLASNSNYKNKGYLNKLEIRDIVSESPSSNVNFVFSLVGTDIEIYTQQLSVDLSGGLSASLIDNIEATSLNFSKQKYIKSDLENPVSDILLPVYDLSQRKTSDYSTNATEDPGVCETTYYEITSPGLVMEKNKLTITYLNSQGLERTVTSNNFSLVRVGITNKYQLSISQCNLGQQFQIKLKYES